jgi:hypothetical protein
LAEQGKALVACDLEGHTRWRHRREEGASGCKALAVDEGVVYVLGGLAGVDAEGGSIYKLSAKDGKPVPWPSGALDLKIASLWPTDAKTKPDKADSMAVRHGHIYLTFTNSEFLAVLNAKTGAYLQTVVGAPPGMIDVVATQIELPDAPGKLVDADFAVISLGGGVLGKVLFAHDPLWVVTSELSPLEREVKITALSVLGDSAMFHRHEAFVGLGAPFHQVQARPLLDTEGDTWFAGRPGGRPLLGPWVPDALRAISGVALAADGKVWVAEGDAFPKRFSVWDTSGQQGKLVREFFGPSDGNACGGAINPVNPNLMFAQGCEWRIDPNTGRANCLGVVTREPVKVAKYGVGENGRAYLVTLHREREFPSAVSIFERLGDGDYKVRARIYWADKNGAEVMPFLEGATETVIWSDENGDGEKQANERHTYPGVLVVQTAATTQDLTLQVEKPGDEAAYWLLKVASWTACGAPRYEFSAPKKGPGLGAVSADARLMLAHQAANHGPILSCSEVTTERELWKLSVNDDGHRDALPLCSARLAEPIGNVWLAAVDGGVWHLINEDGFDLAQLFETDSSKIRWPKEARPDADMTHAAKPPAGEYTMAQGIDGKLYLQAGDSAYWNLEITGLEKVKPLPGGKITVPQSP